MSKYFEALILVLAFLYESNGCQMEGVTLWPVPVTISIMDTFSGEITSRSTFNIEGILNVNYGEGMIGGPYLEVSHSNSLFVMTTTPEYANYEDIETATSMSLTVTFTCTGGSTNTLIFLVNVIDTNNNAPQFIPTNQFEFVVTPPLPPGFLVTGCLDYITVRDIDLTTQRIDFTIEENPYFEIEYDAAASTVSKEFNAVLRTTTLIRSLTEPINLTITATDVDQTGDPPLTTTATVTIKGDTEFALPEEPVFSEPFYILNYTIDHQLVHTETILLEQGFDEHVTFTLEGDYKDNFSLNVNDNQVTIVVTDPLLDILTTRQIYLILRANRENTSGGAATIIVQFPEVSRLVFEQSLYLGTIENDTLFLPPLVLIEGYENTNVSVSLDGVQSTYFESFVEGNLVTLTMDQISDDVIENNSFIWLEVTATSTTSSAVCGVHLEIIKDDSVTPLFDKSIYHGTYDPVTGLDVEQIVFVQGYDETVNIEIFGEHSSYFNIERDGESLVLTTTYLPQDIFGEHHVILSVEADKPRTVGANAAVIIALPAVITDNVHLAFDKASYIGLIDNDQVDIPVIILSDGYSENVTFTLHGDLSSYFTLSSEGPVVTVTLTNTIPETSRPANGIVVLEVQASAPPALPAYTTLVIELVRDDISTSHIELEFAQTFYTGTYTETSGLQFTTPISIVTGYDSSVEFALEGDSSEYFGLIQNDNSVVLTLTSPIPAGVLANNQQLIFVINAQRDGASVARATIVIMLTDEYMEGLHLAFEQVSYVGSIDNDQIAIPVITLSEGYSESVSFTLHGDLSSYFTLSSEGPIVTVTLTNTIPETSRPANGIVVLEVQASAPPALPAYTTLVIELVRDDISTSHIELEFAQTFYTGTYTETSGLQFTTPILIVTGYDPSVEFALEGDSSEYFGLIQNDNSLLLTLTSPIPAGVLANNQQLIFEINAQRDGASVARATIVIMLTDEYMEGLHLAFEQVSYVGSIDNDQIAIPVITLSEGYSDSVSFTLHGDLSSYFTLSSEGPIVTVTLTNTIPETSRPANGIVVLEVQASAPPALPAYTTLIIELVRDDISTSHIELEFAQTFYTGTYTETSGLQFTTPILIVTGYDPSVEFALEGDSSEYFGLIQNDNSVLLTLTSPIPAGVLANNQQLIFEINAQRDGASVARATIVIMLTDEYMEGLHLAFEQVSYVGSIDNDQIAIPVITLSEGYSESVSFTLHGDLSSYFTLSSEGPIVTVALTNTIPETLRPANGIVLLEVQASAPPALPAYTTLVIELVRDDISTSDLELEFSQTFYTGTYTEASGLQFTTPISIVTGYDPSVEFALEGDSSEYFGLIQNDNSVVLTLTSPIPAGVLANNQQLIFVINAQRDGTSVARATIVIMLTDEYTEGLHLAFEQVSYVGSIDNDQIAIPAITLSEGYSDSVSFTLHGDLSSYFTLSSNGPIVTVTLTNTIPETSRPANGIVVLEVQASAPPALPAYTTLVIELVRDDISTSHIELEFSQTFYTGTYTETSGLQFTTPISLVTGYDSNVEFALEGDSSEYFGLIQNGNSVLLTLTSPIPAGVLASSQQLIFVVTAQRDGANVARATVVIKLANESQVEADVSFSKILYEGVIENNVVYHEEITVNHFSGSTIELSGEYSSLFDTSLINGIVTVQMTGTIIPSVTHIPLELKAGNSGAVLILNIQETSGGGSETSAVVTFSSQSYAIRVDITQTGTIGQVEAIADNGEPVAYSLRLNNSHLEQRLTINAVGELFLSAPVNSGFYTFQALATTVFTQISGQTTIHLSVETVTVCGSELVMPPLIVLDRDEEEPHRDLINGTQYQGCTFMMTNRWPLEQDWLYVDETGLHTTAIDREHESIAFMPVSQVQVEVTLHCEGDSTRTKRSMNSDSRGPYDYGNNRWLLTESILFNSRRTFVNLIVNDINDNTPIFDGKAMEPIAVGCPIPELQAAIMPRSLAELKATDADIGENAAIVYWSSEDGIAVSPTTGFVHLRDGVTLEENTILTIHATDRNGLGLTGSIQLIVKLLDENNIAVVTVKDAFLDDETTIVSYLKDAVGYELKVLRSAIVTHDSDQTRHKREVENSSGTTLQLYLYGLIEQEPVLATRLIEDITNTQVTAVNIVDSLSLGDHLASQEICVISARETSLLVATIVLSVLLFVIIVLIALWYFLKWRKKNYVQFSDENSLTSRIESMEETSKPEVAPMPRINIEELKRSERRLQEMLNAPVPMEEEVPPKEESLIDIPLPDPNATIVIQSFDKLKDAEDESSDDEFGEKPIPRRKSVVTFNENVEKIIHLEDIDNEDSSSNADTEVYRF